MIHMRATGSCAQLLCLFLARERDPATEQSIGANELDKTYHDNTDFQADGDSARRFEELMRQTAEVLNHAWTNNLGGSISKRSKRKGVFKKLEVIAVFFLLSDLTRSPNLKLDKSFYQKLGRHLGSENNVKPGGKIDLRFGYCQLLQGMAEQTPPGSRSPA